MTPLPTMHKSSSTKHVPLAVWPAPFITGCVSFPCFPPQKLSKELEAREKALAAKAVQQAAEHAAAVEVSIRFVCIAGAMYMVSLQ